ncbi:MAG TPA: hypothetical protein VEC37_17675 [Bacillota bacterium]|nr:hypothetical protein [Bacillota bacterium]
MKKFLALALSMLMTLGLASASLANTLYMDIFSGGEVDIEEFNETCDLSQVGIGIDIPFGDLKLGANITSSVIDDYAYDSYSSDYFDVDTASVLLKGGFALINDRQFRLDVTGGFFDRIIAYDNSRYYDEEDSFYSLTVGVDAKIKFNRTAWVDFSYAYGLDPRGKYINVDYYDDYEEYDSFNVDSISVMSCKLNLLLTDQIGASIGYSKETIGFDRFDKETYSGLTIGAFYKF